MEKNQIPNPLKGFNRLVLERNASQIASLWEKKGKHIWETWCLQKYLAFKMFLMGS